VSVLVLCPACSRHVKSEESACPFCQAELLPRACAGRCFGAPEARLGRLALMAAGAALLGVACQSTGPVPAYGAPPHVDTGAPTDGPPDAGDMGK
jgi:hypothetical protein